MDFWVGTAPTLNLNVWLLILNLQLVEFLSNLLILMSKNVKLLLVVADGLEELWVGSFSGEELLNNLLHVREPSLSPDLLESLLDLSRTCHFLVHLWLEEGTPELLCQEVLVHLELVLILVVIGGLVTDLLLSRITFDASLKGGLFVVEWFQDRSQTVLPLEMVLIDEPH